MTDCRARSSGRPSSRSWSARRSQDPVSATHVVHRLPHGEDPRRLLVGHLHAVRVLELLDQAVEVQGVGLEVLLEPRPLLHARGIELELVGQVRTDVGEDLVAGHGSGTVAGASDDLASARGLVTALPCWDRRARWVHRWSPLQRPRGGEPRMRPADHVLAHAARGELHRARDPLGPERAVRDHAQLPQAEQERAALGLRVDRVAQLAQRGPQQRAAGLGAAGRHRRLAHRAQQRVRRPLHHLQEDVAGEAVGDDHVGLARADREALDVAEEVQPLGRGELRVGGLDDLRALLGLRAVGEQRHARGAVCPSRPP